MTYKCENSQNDRHGHSSVKVNPLANLCSGERNHIDPTLGTEISINSISIMLDSIAQSP